MMSVIAHLKASKILKMKTDTPHLTMKTRENNGVRNYIMLTNIDE